MLALKHILRIGRRVRKRLCKKNDTFARHFNTPIRFEQKRWFVNERIVEVPYILQQMAAHQPGARVLEFGCTRSTLALSLASLGYDVTGVDLRPYPFTHPSLSVFEGNLMDFEAASEFDVVVAVSVLEHVGLGAYGEAPDDDALSQIIQKLGSLLKKKGQLLVTVPTGQAYVDGFLRSFLPQEFKQMFARKELELVEEAYFCRSELKTWKPCTRAEIAEQDNSRTASAPTGVNGVGCFTWQKRAD